MTSPTPENPIQITDRVETTLCLENYKENYPRWEREIFDVLRDHRLLDYFYGTNCPSMPADSTASVEFEHWKKKDKAIWNWLFSTLHPDTQSFLGKYARKTTHLLWRSLRFIYSIVPLPSEFDPEDPPFIAKTSTRSSRTPENPTNPQISSTYENPIEINHQINIPLNDENYEQSFPDWESEVLQVLGGLGLQDYLDRTMGHGVRWEQDELIRSWLWSSLPPTIVCELRYQPCATTEELWECLHSMYTAHYFPKVRKLKLELQTIKKGNATCADYLQQFNVIIEQLINAGYTLDKQQQVSYFLQGLGQEFEPFVTSITRTSQTLTMTDLLGCLFDEEKRLFSLAQPLIVHNPGTTSSNDIYFIGQNSSLFAGPSQYTPPFQPPIVHHPGQYAGYAPVSQPWILHNPGQNSSLFADRAQPVMTNAYAAPYQPPPTLNLDNFFSLHNIGTDQAHMDNGAGLGAEDSDIARSLPQDTSLIPLQTRNPATGNQLVIISDDEEDAD